MITLSVPDMSCDHCTSTVKGALARLDPSAKVDVDLGAQLVKVDTTAPLAAVVAALDAAGYPAAQV